jgi:phosphopantothenoylcysteine decarboxylase/phosphopantothenate--cysteine ligase
VNCLVTAGPTYEPLDEVRRLTNFSTGRLGTELANCLTARGHSVTLLVGEQSTWPGERRATRVEVFGTTEDLRTRLQAKSSKDVDAVFHAAAVGDFRFGKVWQRTPDGALTAVQAGKIPTRLGSLLVELQPTEKIIHRLRDWFPSACLVGWKYEMDGDREAVIAKAVAQMRESRTDACVANGRAYGLGFGLVSGAGPCVHLRGAEPLYEALESLATLRQPGSDRGHAC